MGGRSIAALEAGARKVVAFAGVEYEIEAVAPRDLMAYTARYLQHVPLAVAQERAMEIIADEHNGEPSPDQYREAMTRALREQLSKSMQANPDEAGHRGQTFEAWVCAGVRRIRVEGQEWDRVQFVMHRKDATDVSGWTQEDYDAANAGERLPPGIWVGRLTKNAVEYVAGRIAELSGWDRRAADVAASFRHGPGRSAEGGRDRETEGEVPA